MSYSLSFSFTFSPVYLLSLGFILLVLALRLSLLLWAMRGGKEENLRSSGIWFLVIGVIILFISATTRLINLLSVQESTVLANTAAAIATIGVITALQGIVKQKPNARRSIKCWALAVLLLGIACIIVFAVLR